MAYKVFCERCKTSEIAQSKVEVAYLINQHDREHKCLEANWKRIS